MHSVYKDTSLGEVTIIFSIPDFVLISFFSLHAVSLSTKTMEMILVYNLAQELILDTLLARSYADKYTRLPNRAI